MRISRAVGVLICGAWVLNLTAVYAGELSGYVAVEGRYFFQDPLYAGQEEHNGSISAQPEYYHKWDNGSSFTFVPFVRLDSADSERTHFDIREMYYLFPGDSWTFRIGVTRVFWGTTEFEHLVDIINQTDFIENIDGEDKLGQPMVNLTFPRKWGTLDFYILPYFRERTFPGTKGRLRPALPIDTGRTIYESRDREHSFDMAVRYSHTIGDCDFGIYYFRGTNRQTWLLPGTNDIGEPILIPAYDKIDQFGFDLGWAVGNWMWKLEAINREGYGYRFFAATGGFEYTFYSVSDSRTDIGIVGEYAYNERRDEAVSPFDNDIMLGLRWTPNDAADTQCLIGFMKDVVDPTSLFTIEASRRFGKNWRLNLELWSFFNVAEDSYLYSIRDDDFLRLELAYYF